MLAPGKGVCVSLSVTWPRIFCVNSSLSENAEKVNRMSAIKNKVDFFIFIRIKFSAKVHTRPLIRKKDMMSVKK